MVSNELSIGVASRFEEERTGRGGAASRRVVSYRLVTFESRESSGVEEGGVLVRRAGSSWRN